MRLLSFASENQPRSPSAAAHRRRRWRSWARPGQVAGLLVVTVLLSGIDLVLTLRAMLTTGMFEANPLLHHLIALTGDGAPLAIIAFKALTVSVAVAVLYRLRHHGQALLGSWATVIVLAALTVQWLLYLQEMAGLDPEMLRQIGQAGGQWVKL